MRPYAGVTIVINSQKKRAFTLVEIMIVVAILGILVAIAVPNFYRARELSRMRACQENLNKIDGAKEQYALEANLGPGDPITFADLVGQTLYLRSTPVCPASGTYTVGNSNEDPACSLSTAAAFPHTFEIAPPGF